MPSLQAVRANGRTYWRIVESRRVNGKPRAVPIEHLGRTADLLARLQGTDALRVRSLSHGAVGALYALSRELNIARVIDERLAEAGRRLRPAQEARGASSAPVLRDGLSVGQSLVLVAIGRACCATSKRAFADWAKTTTLGEIAGVDVEKLTSQHFWDQMDQFPVELIETVEREVVAGVLEKVGLTLDTLLFDATNFFTFIASSNTRCHLPARGKQKQKRNDLRQVGVAMLCSRQHGIPLWHRTYGGNVADSKCFSEVLPALKRRMTELGRGLDTVTMVYDKGNVSRDNQQEVDRSGIHYISGLTVASQREFVDRANRALEPVELIPGDAVMAYRAREQVWGEDRTLVALVSERLREGQMVGVMQHVLKALRWLAGQAEMLRRGKQKRDRARIERDIETRLGGRQHLSELIRVRLTGQDPNLSLTFKFDEAAFERLASETFGRLVLMTNRHDWPTADIIRAPGCR